VVPRIDPQHPTARGGGPGHLCGPGRTGTRFGRDPVRRGQPVGHPDRRRCSGLRPVVHRAQRPSGDTVKNSTRSFDQAWGALQLWAAGLDGRISGDELKKIQDSIADGWNNTQGARDYLRSVNDRINAGQADQVVQEALRVISQQADEKKVMVMRSVADFMKANGVTWEQTQQVMGKWVVQVLKLSPMDVVNFVKSLDK